MFSYISRLLDNSTLSPHGICLLWRPELLWTHVVSDAVIFMAYMTIPVALGVIIHRRRDIPFGWMIWCFALFITACGFTHAMGIWTLWHPDYGVEALIKVVTAMASLGTAAALWLLIPIAVNLPSPAHLRQINQELERRILERDQAIADLTREREERQKAEAALLQSQKMDALGQLTGGIAHDFNNLLQAVQGSLDLIHRRAADPVKVQHLAQSGLNATARGAKLTGKLLAFARTKQLKLEPFLVADMVAEMRELLTRSIGPNVDLRFDLDREDIPVLTDRTQAELALLNLVINARDAAPDGRVVIRTERYEAAPGEAGLEPGVYVRLSVIDDGAGMSADVVSRAFDPFFTTKPMGEGTGLGLSQVYGVARQTGGAARIESEPGRGTTVSIFIPKAIQAPQEMAVVKGPTRSARLPNARILLVDDDEFVRLATAEALDNMGLAVLQASDGPAALELAQGGGFDLALLDYAMPGMTGAELAGRLRSIRPGLKIVFVTGYADSDELNAVLGPNATVLRKPYLHEELQVVLAGALADPQAG